MTDVVVSVRMPSSLVSKLKILATENHYKDLSEEIRSVIRTKCMKFVHPSYSPEFQKLRSDLASQLGLKKEKDNKQKMISELQSIIEKLKK